MPDFKPYKPPFQWRFLSPPYWPLWLGLGGLWCIAWWPQRWRVGLSRWLGRLIWRRNAKRREIVEANLAWCFPEMDGPARRKLARDYFRYLTQSILDTGVLWWRDIERVRRHIRFQGADHLQKALQEGRAVMILGGHSPALEKGGVALSMDYPMTSFTNEAKNPLLEWVAARRRMRFGGYVFPRGGGFRQVIKALRNDYGLYILTDEDLGAESSLFVPFFGIPKATLTTPLRLAKSTNAVILTSYSWFDDEQGCYVMRLSAPLEGITEQDEESALALLNQHLEASIREHPAQYMWSLRLFKTMFDGSLPPYRMRSRPGSGPRPRPDVNGANPGG